jgi:drug/metabolite transporter (DMT)-like permease
MRTHEASAIPSTRSRGLGLALTAAVISGIAIFTNAYGVKAFGDPTVYTTAKNLVAAVVLLTLLLTATRRGSVQGFTRPHKPGQWAGLVVVGIIGGSVPFALFFEGLARASSSEAAFIQKTLVVWVALLAAVFLGERVGPWQVGAVALLVWGQAVLGGGVRGIGLGPGETMIFVATLLWSVEIVVAKKLLRSLSPLTVGAARMLVGVAILIGYVLATTSWSQLAAIGPRQWGWAVFTGLILAGYVITWFSALASARAVDVTAVLVFGAIVTALLQATVQGTPLAPQTFGLSLVAIGSVAAIALALRRPREARVPT